MRGKNNSLHVISFPLNKCQPQMDCALHQAVPDCNHLETHILFGSFFKSSPISK